MSLSHRGRNKQSRGEERPLTLKGSTLTCLAGVWVLFWRVPVTCSHAHTLPALNFRDLVSHSERERERELVCRKNQLQGTTFWLSIHAAPERITNTCLWRFDWLSITHHSSLAIARAQPLCSPSLPPLPLLVPEDMKSSGWSLLLKGTIRPASSLSYNAKGRFLVVWWLSRSCCQMLQLLFWRNQHNQVQIPTRTRQSPLPHRRVLH